MCYPAMNLRMVTFWYIYLDYLINLKQLQLWDSRHLRRYKVSATQEAIEKKIVFTQVAIMPIQHL